MRPNRSILLLPLLLLIVLALATQAHAEPPTPADPFARAAAQPADIAPGDGVTRLAPPTGCALFEGASPSSVADAAGAVYWSAFSNCGGVWGLRVFRFDGQASNIVGLPGGAIPRARGILDMEPGGLYLTGWDNKIAWRIAVPGAAPWPPVLVTPRVALPLVGQR